MRRPFITLLACIRPGAAYAQQPHPPGAVGAHVSTFGNNQTTILIGLSHITRNRHRPTDVAGGAAPGHVTGRQVVNNDHHYAKLKAPQQNRGVLRHSIRHGHARAMPGPLNVFG